MSSPLRVAVRGEQPPKKDGANSMWKKPVEVRRLAILRQAVAEAVDGQEVPQEPLELRLRVWADRSAGDLDNFVTGVCDGLMAAHTLVRVDAADWKDLPAAAWPDRALVYSDDNVIDRVVAERLSPLVGELGYELEIASAGHQNESAH